MTENEHVSLDDLFSSSSSDEENTQPSSNQQVDNSYEDDEDYMDDQFIKSLELIEHERLPSVHPSEVFESKKLSFKNVPLELIQAYNTARDEKQFKKAHHLKKQIREYNIKEEMLEKAKLSLSKSLIVQEEEKEAGKQSIGLKLLKRMGFEQGGGLGKNNQGSVAPISIDKQLDYLMESMDKKKKPIIGLDEVQTMKKEEIDKFKSEMEKKQVKTAPPTEEEFTKIMREKHKEQKRKRKLRMALNETAAEEVAKKKKQDDEWDEFEDF